MAHTIFFSWQTDTATRSGRNFIQKALEEALAQVAGAPEVEEAIRDGLEVDRDTKGVAGQPPIMETIFKKIDAAAVFVPDLTFVGVRGDRRPTPNPNVLIEYGWALKSLGHGRIVAVMNAAYGKPAAETLPFDLGHLRHPICYELAEDADAATRKAERQKLVAVFKDAIAAVLDSEEFKSTLPKPPAPPPFPAVEPKEGRSRFREPGVALGVRELFNMPKEEVRLRSGPSLWLRVMPVSGPGKDFTTPFLMKAAKGEDFPLFPIFLGSSSYSFLRAADGVGMYPVDGVDEATAGAVAFVFRSGEVWAIDTYALAHGNGIPFLEKEMATALTRYGSLLGKMGIEGPFRWVAGVEGIQGRGIHSPPRPGYFVMLPGPYGKCLSDGIVREGRYSPPSSADEALLPFFTALFEECGDERPSWLPIPR